MLHWLPVKYRVEFKTLFIVFKGLHGKAPSYIQEMITPSKIFHEIQWGMYPEGSKIPARYFRQACIRSLWASGMEFLASGN